MMKSKGILRPERFFLSGIFIVVIAFPLYATDESIHPSSWVYTALRRFELLGLVEISPDIPISRSEAERYVCEIERRVEDRSVELKAYESFLLKRLLEEFKGKGDSPSLREDRPAVIYRDSNGIIMGDISAACQWQKTLDREKGEVDGTFVPGVVSGIGNRITLQSELQRSYFSI